MNPRRRDPRATRRSGGSRTPSRASVRAPPSVLASRSVGRDRGSGAPRERHAGTSTRARRAARELMPRDGVLEPPDRRVAPRISPPRIIRSFVPTKKSACERRQLHRIPATRRPRLAAPDRSAAYTRASPHCTRGGLRSSAGARILRDEARGGRQLEGSEIAERGTGTMSFVRGCAHMRN